MEEPIAVLVVDDERTTRNGLMHHVRWNDLGAPLDVACAGSAVEALALSDERPPDIILSDVRMPGMDGVALCEEVRQRFPDCTVLFLSGYSDKPYLKAAIQLQALGYIEKPVDPLEVESYMRQAVSLQVEKRLRRNRESALTERLPLLQRAVAEMLTGVSGPFDRRKLEEDLHVLGRFGSTRVYRAIRVLCASPFPDQGSLGQAFADQFADYCPESDYVAVPVSNRLVMVIAGGRSDAAWRNPQGLLRRLPEFAAFHRLNGGKLFLACGHTVTQWEDVRESWRQATELERLLYYTGYGACVEWTEQRASERIAEEIRGTWLEQFRQAVFHLDAQAAQALLTDAYGRLRTATATPPEFVRTFYREAIHQLLHIGKRAEGLCQDDVWNQYEELDTLEDTHAFVLGLLAEQLASAEGKAPYSPAVRHILNRIHREFSRVDLSVGQLAEEVGLTCPHLTTMFKKETGLTIGPYIQRIRLQHACSLLANPRYRLEEIAARSGYADPSYFAKSFKKAIGVTPSHYRKTILG
jgi:two-component system response regulator YesN